MSARRFVPIADWVRVYGRPMRVAILERRSKDDPDTKSLQVQHDTCLRWLNSLPAGSWSCDLRLAEDGGDVYRQIVSAWRGKGNHRLLRQIMARLTEYDVVVVYRIDRFGRNVVTVLTTLDQMREAGVRLYSVEENLDTADPSQQFNSQLFAMLAQHSSDLLGTADGLVDI
ncbi:recombinase family protein [Lapillicoccus jejuensis]|uniref:Resolvase-like protein n=1 Tax=Lapillicoccus jejuensis TaxID=402171 RepID=A0A542DWX0_9MICO|nr:recombinase family protein [Lapillicoccus jejuensis]TQJ07589.1 resolvase-like protein [Lapillicoccus jejuensis]